MMYVEKYKYWPKYLKKTIKYARGRVLDIGCRDNRYPVYLQGKGLNVVVIHNSPNAIKEYKQSGLRDARVISVNQIDSDLGVFDTILILGESFGELRSYEGVRQLLEKLEKITSPKARIIADTVDVYDRSKSVHLTDFEFHRREGGMGGELRVRDRLRERFTPWYDYLMVSEEQMENILKGTGWKVKKYIREDSPVYAVIIEKKKR